MLDIQALNQTLALFFSPQLLWKIAEPSSSLIFFTGIHTMCFFKNVYIIYIHIYEIKYKFKPTERVKDILVRLGSSRSKQPCCLSGVAMAFPSWDHF